MAWPCCSNTIIPNRPCSGVHGCKQAYDAHCVLVDGTIPACFPGSTNPAVDDILKAYCTTLNDLQDQIDSISGDISLTATVDLSSAEILAIFDTPIEVVAAPGAGKAIQVLGGFATLDYNSSAYGAFDTLVASIETADFPQGGFGGLLKSTSDSSTMLHVSSDSTTFSGNQIVENQALVITSGLGANPTGGNSPVKVYITYKIVTL